MDAPLPPVVSLWSVAGDGAAVPVLPMALPVLDGIAGDPAEALRKAARGHPGRDVLLLRTDAEWPAAAWPRLEAGWRGSEWDVLSPLDGDDLVGLDEVATTRRDARCWLVGEHRSFAAPRWSPVCSLWRGRYLRASAGTPGSDAASGLLPCLYVGPAATATATTAAAAPLALARLRQRLELAAGGLDARIDIDIDKPAVLHILHSWGGGIERFARDLASADPLRRHLHLVASGDNDQPPFGRRLALHADLGAPPLQVWPLAAPIEDTALASVEVEALLSSVIEQWGIGSVLVSSLIGHSLDVLRTGLPTAVCGHDAYPLWPMLHDVRDPTREAFDLPTLRLELAGVGPEFVFTSRDADHWWRLRQAYLVTLQEHAVRLVAPSASARERLCAIAPELAQRDWRQIAHGLGPWASAVSAPAPRKTGEPLRVLVPGRLNGHKGEVLLAPLIDQLPTDIELILLGSGVAGERFLGRRGVHLLKNYDREQLPRWLGELAPDVALLPSTVPETWGYTLSEMLALGLPVLALDRGAYGERLAAGGGWAVAANTVLAKLRELAADRALLDAVRAARTPMPPGLEAMAAAWREALPSAPRPLHLPQATHETVSRIALELANDAARAELRARESTLAEQQAELDRRADWARNLEIERDRACAKATHAEAARLTQQLGHEAAMRNADERQQAQFAALEEVQRREQGHLDRLAGRDAELEALRVALEHSGAELAALRLDLDRVDVERAHLASRLAQTLDRNDALSQELAESHRYYQRDTVDLARQRDIALAQRNDLETRLRQVQRHPAWRMAAPLRWLVDRLQRLATRASYRVMLTRSLWARGRQSLRIRGWVGSWRRLQERRRMPPPSQALRIPAAAAQVDPESLKFAPAAQPRASIVVPVFNQLPYTLACLRSLADAADELAFEVIVVDDGSNDDSRAVLPTIPGLRYHRNAANLGFIGACNAGAALARGDFLVFLNNDTVVQSGWLKALLATFERHPDTGLAGSKLVYPDGRLQEAGGIVFADGSAWNYGRFDDPAHPEYNYVREVDYCSGAAIALPRTLFERLGGFDTRYAPAYYEDTDLAMRVREAGLKVRYQPASVVLHFEGVTAGTDLGSGVKAHQVRNQRVFFERWQETLRRDHPAPGSNIRRACEHRCPHGVLVLDACTPMPDRDSGSVRMRALMRLLLEEGCALSFFPENHAHDGGYTEELQQLGVAAWWQPWLGGIPRWLEQHGPRFDLVIVSRHYVLSPLLPLLRQCAPQARIVFDTVDLHFLREQREAELSGDPARARAAARTRERELDLIHDVDVTWVVSAAEQALLAREASGDRIEVLSNIHEARGAGPPYDARAGLLFVGGYRHPPNVDAAIWLADEILPRIQAQLPDVELHLVGGDAPPAVLALGERPGIRFHGYLPDLLPLLDGVRVALAPLRYGAGVKGKVNQSLAHGQPVVATTCAVEGMYLVDGQDVLVADEPEAFAAAVVRLYREEALWRTLAAGGLANTRKHFSPEAARPVLRRLLHGLPNAATR